ncbi:hypothetical protein [Methylocella sp.]|jgi:hypothetical protein|uniref:hypothetical protein n=1 Tax=Methylocella sp. TaxID=1978226 RepID=UPI003C791404
MMSGDGLGNIPSLERRNPMIEAGADEEHDNRNGEGEQAGRFDRCHHRAVSECD